MAIDNYLPETKRDDMNTLEKGTEMMSIPMGQLPPLAMGYAKHLSLRYGTCMEVLLSAWCAYAEVVLGLEKTDDIGYHAPPEAYAWFEAQPEFQELKAQPGGAL